MATERLLCQMIIIKFGVSQSILNHYSYLVTRSCFLTYHSDRIRTLSKQVFESLPHCTTISPVSTTYMQILIYLTYFLAVQITLNWLDSIPMIYASSVFVNSPDGIFLTFKDS